MSALLSVEEALRRILEDVEPTPPEIVPITNAHGRVLAESLSALLTQPPFDASAMDGYAVRAADIRQLPATLSIIGQAAAGHPFTGRVDRGEAVRIFTGAPVPEGADAIVIQENTEREADKVIVHEGSSEAGHIRNTGFDFRAGETLLAAGRRLGPREISLASAMGHGRIGVRKRPRIAILSTGDELVEPGTTPGQGQIVASNHLGVAALAQAAGAVTEQLGIARDTRTDLEEHLSRAKGADVIVTSGGASVGDHDLVAPVLEAAGMALAFWKIAMRPGKPLMFGRWGNSRVFGLPGNPVSSLICTRIFLLPLIRALLGEPIRPETTTQARLLAPLEANGPRQHYMRAVLSQGPDGLPEVTPVRSQDSSLLSPLAMANCLLVRAPGAPAASAGAMVAVLSLDM